MTKCERYDSHMDVRCVNAAYGILTYVCDECGAEWQEEA